MVGGFCRSSPRVFGEQQSELGGVGSGRDEGQIGARKQGRWAASPECCALSVGTEAPPGLLSREVRLASILSVASDKSKQTKTQTG